MDPKVAGDANGRNDARRTFGRRRRSGRADRRVIVAGLPGRRARRVLVAGVGAVRVDPLVPPARGTAMTDLLYAVGERRRADNPFTGGRFVPGQFPSAGSDMSRRRYVLITP